MATPKNKKTYTFSKVLIDMFSDVDGSISSKRIITFLAFVCVMVGFYANVFWALVPAEFIFEGVLWLTGAGLGFIASEKFSSSRTTKNDTEEG